ncbi:non-ribosomal peptide synthetase [Merismopedia glauca]|nr:non-ribosomal peptide synthetase [Merismopedia glauca]
MSLEVQIFNLVSRITGHQVVDLEPDLFLESDLGLDSIKIVELLNGLIQLIPESEQPEFVKAVPISKLMQIQTLGELTQIADSWVVSQPEKTGSTEALETVKEVTAELNNLEIIDSQYLHLVSYWLTNSNSLFATIRLEGNLNIKVLQASWQDLIERHPLLRSHFIISGATRFQDYRLEVVDNPTLPEIPVTELRHIDRSTQTKVIHEVLQRFLNWEWKLTEFPLHKFFLIRLEDSVYQLVLANEHLISDGLGNHIILRELMEIYRAKETGDEPNLPPATTVEEYLKVVKGMNNWKDSEAGSASVKETYFWNPTGNTLASIRPQYANLPYCLGKELTAKLISQTSIWRLPLNSLLLAAFLKTVAQFDQDSTSFILQVPTSGRVYPGIDASDIVSSFAQNLGLSFPTSIVDEPWEILLKQVHQEVQTGLLNHDDKVQSHQMAIAFKNSIPLQDGAIPEHILPMFQSAAKSNLYVPFTGHTQIKTQYGSLKVTDYRAGGINAAGTIDILQEIFDDNLHLFASYDGGFFPKSLIERLMGEYINQLEELANLKPSLVADKPQLFLDTQIDSQIKIILQQAVREIAHISITDADLDLDLEADMGMDSLEMVRLVAQLENQLGKVNRQRLLACRSLREMGMVLGETRGHGEVEDSRDVAMLRLGDGRETELLPLGDKIAEIPYLEIIQQVDRTPDAIAILDGETQVTYRELHRLSNQVARYLTSQGVKPGKLVGVMLDRSPLLWVGILGILKAGGAYVPLDPAYPPQRLQYMLQHAEIEVLLTESGLNEQINRILMPDLPLQTLMFLDSKDVASLRLHTPDITSLRLVNREMWCRESDADLEYVNHPDDLMTVLYTSGSTGQPKGVMLNHRGYHNRLKWMQKAFNLSVGDRVAQKTSCCFDISVWEIFWGLMVGATVCPVKREIVTNPWDLAAWMKKMQISVMHFVPSLFGEFIQAMERENQAFPHLRWLIFSGEALPVAFIARWMEIYGDKVGLANLYGPTEASIDVTAHIIKELGEFSIPIGKAIDNVDILILDDRMQPVSPGELGELWIGGIQLAQGYLKDPVKTAAAFHPNPFPHIIGKHLYRTGDLAKELPDGSIEYHGRIDSQVKIRGFRVELGEVESVLSNHPEIREAAVIVVDYDSGHKRLIAGLAGNEVESKQLRQYLQQYLPDYMIPHRFVWLASLPKNHNGKLDRKALRSTIDGNPEAAPTPEYLPLGSAQRWLINYFEPPYQWCGYTRFRYCDRLDSTVFTQAFNLLVERHSALRTKFLLNKGQWQQQVVNLTESVTVQFYDGTSLDSKQLELEITNLIQETSKNLQINRFPLIKALAIQVEPASWEIVFIAHHLIADMVSGGILFSDFWQAYRELLINPNFIFPNSPPASYSDYVNLMQQAEDRGELAQDLEYWRSQFPSPEFAFHVPLDGVEGANIQASTAKQRFILPKPASEQLLKGAKQHYRTSLYPLLLAPLYQLMATWSQQPWVVISHRMHGRNPKQTDDFMGTVGNFAVNFPVGIEVNQNWENVVQQIHQKLEEVPANGTTFDWIGDRLPSYIYPDCHLTPVRVNYLGNRALPSSDLFQFAESDLDSRFSLPEQKRTTLLEFFLSVVDGELQLEIEYSRNFHAEATISDLGTQYLDLISKMLSCINQPALT